MTAVIVGSRKDFILKEEVHTTVNYSVNKTSQIKLVGKYTFLQTSCSSFGLFQGFSSQIILFFPLFWLMLQHQYNIPAIPGRFILHVHILVSVRPSSGTYLVSEQLSLLSHVAAVGNETKPETYLLNGADCRLVVILVRLPFHSLTTHPSTHRPPSSSQW